MCPDPQTLGVLVARPVAVEARVFTEVPLILIVSLPGVERKLVPVMVMGTNDSPIVGVNETIVGSPGGGVTVKLEPLVTVPLELVTVIVPLVAAAGTVVTIWVLLEEVTVAATPLKTTVFWLGVELNPEPSRVTVAPGSPLVGEKATRASWFAPWRLI